jgi:hypothetical protein
MTKGSNSSIGISNGFSMEIRVNELRRQISSQEEKINDHKFKMIDLQK